MSQGRSDGSVLIEAKLSLDQYEKDLAAMQKQTEGFAKGLTKGLDSSATAAKDATAGMGKLQNSLSGLTAAYAKGNQAATANVNTFLRQTSVLAEQALAYNAVQKAAQDAALAEKTAAEAQVKSLSALLDSLGEQVLARRREIEAMGESAAGGAALAERTKARKELTALEQEAERAATLLAKADDALAASSLKLGQSLKAPLGVLPALKTGFTSLWKLLGGFPGLLITGAAAAISYFTGTMKKSETDAYSFSASLKGIYGSANEAREGINRLRQEIAAMSQVEAQFNLDRLEKQFADLESEALRLQKFDISGWSGQVEGPLNKIIEAMKNGTISANDYKIAILATANANKNLVTESDIQKALDWGKRMFEISETLKVMRDRAAGLGSTLSETIRRIDEAQKIATPEDAIKFLDSLTRNTNIAKQASIDLSKAKAQEALAMLEAAIATEQDADVKAAAIKKLEAYKAALAAPDFKWDFSGRSGKSTSDIIKEIRKEIDALNTTDTSSFTKGLSDGLARIEEKLGKTSDAAKALRDEFTKAYSTKFLEGVNRELMELEGNSAALAQLDIDRKVADYATALNNVGIKAKAATQEVERYRSALEKQQAESEKKTATDTFRDQITFLKELADLSGDYGLSLEYQNKLIDIQAEEYRALFANRPELQGFVDQWAALAKNAQNAQTAIERAVNASWKKLEQGTGTGVDVMTAALGSVMEGYKNAAHSTAQIWGDFFSSFSKGAADSIGKAIVYGDDLGESLNNVAQQAIASLISAFMELAIQAAIVKPLMEALGLSMGESTTGTSTDASKDAEAVKAKTEAELESIAKVSAAKIAAMTAEGTAAAAAAAITAAALTPIAAALTAMWTTPALLASVATQGGAATAGLTALQTALSTAKTTMAISGFDEGGYTGNGSTSDVAGVVHGQEYVINAAATRAIGVGNLDAINASGSLASVFTGRTSALSNLERQQSGGDMYVNVINNASDTTVSQQQSTDASGNRQLIIMVEDIAANSVARGGTVARAFESRYVTQRRKFGV